MNELKPCPFCGGKARIDCNEEGFYWVQCSACMATSSEVRSGPRVDVRDIVREKWNRRASLPQQRTQPEQVSE